MKPPTISGVESGPRIMGCRGSCGQAVCIIYTLIIYVVVYLIIYVSISLFTLLKSRYKFWSREIGIKPSNKERSWLLHQQK